MTYIGLILVLLIIVLSMYSSRPNRKSRMLILVLIAGLFFANLVVSEMYGINLLNFLIQRESNVYIDS